MKNHDLTKSMQEFQVFGLYHGVDSNCTFIVTYKGQPSFVQHSVYFPFLKSLFVYLQYSWGCVLVDHQNTQSNLGPIGNYINTGRTNMSDMSFCAVCNVDIETIWNCGIRTIFDRVVFGPSFGQIGSLSTVRVLPISFSPTPKVTWSNHRGYLSYAELSIEVESEVSYCVSSILTEL